MSTKNGSSCLKDAECQSGFCISYGKCRLGQLGNPCNGEGTCMEGYRCSATTQRCIWNKQGENHKAYSCTSGDNCKKDEFCSKQSSSETGTCLPRISKGSACPFEVNDVWNGESCKDGLACYDKICSEKCYMNRPEMCQNGYVCKTISGYGGAIGACVPQTSTEQGSQQGYGQQEKPPLGQEQQSGHSQEAPTEPPKISDPLKEGGGKNKPPVKKPKKKVKLPKKKLEDETEEESEEEEVTSVPITAVEAGGPAIPSDQNSLFKSLGLPEISNRQAAFYAASTCALLLLLVLSIVFIVACVRRGRKKRAQRRRDLETRSAGPDADLPSYEELHQSTTQPLSFVATEKGSLEKKHE